MAHVAHRRVSRHKLGMASLAALADPFGQTVLDYAHNLLASGILLERGRHVRWRGASALLERLVLGSTSTSRRPAPRRLRDSRLHLPGPELTEDHVLAFARKSKGKSRPPAEPSEPVKRNLDLIGDLLGLPECDRAVLQFIVACDRTDMKELIGPLPCHGGNAPAIIIAAAIARSVHEVEPVLRHKARLAASGLVGLAERGDLDDRVCADSRLSLVLSLSDLDRTSFIDRFLPAAPPASLSRADFPHLDSEVAMAVQMLGTALRAKRAGVNVLLYGPTGTGKSELARLIARELDVLLVVAGKEDDQGRSPEPNERLNSLSLGNRLLGGNRTLLLFDEMEDLFRANPLAALMGGGHQDDRFMSKQWFNTLLETNCVPTIWISNRIAGMDRAFLRRFTYIVEVGSFTAGQRRRAWHKHLGGQTTLSEAEVGALAQRFELSPAHIGSAVAAARLVTDGPVERKTLEAILRPAEKALHGNRAAPPLFAPGQYLPEVANTPIDVEDIARRLEKWQSGDGPGVSLCLYGPPGTGKSEYVRYLAHRMDRPLLVKRVSDIISCWVGESEQNIAAAFEEARKDGAVLLFDEADSFLRDRRDAVRSWEMTQVNEFLQQMEAFSGVFACTTNLMTTLDQASLRRFTFKIPFDFLRSEQAALLFARTLKELGVELPTSSVPAELTRIPNLTPGDFAAVRRRLTSLREVPDPAQLLRELLAEVQVKEAAHGRIGF